MTQSTSQEVMSGPVDLDDLVAQKVSWLPIREGKNYTNNYILDVSARAVRVKATTGLILLGYPFALIGMTLIAMVSRAYQDGDHDIGKIIAFTTGGAIFVLYGLVIAHWKTKLLTFDMVTGRYFGPERHILPSVYEVPKAGDLTDIYALQVISEHADPETNITRYELNLVLRDGERVNVMCQGSLKRMSKAALTLSQFLNVPVWDASVPGEDNEPRNLGKMLITILFLALFSSVWIFVSVIFLLPNGKKHYLNPEINLAMKDMPVGILNPEFCDFNRVTTDSRRKQFDLWGTMPLPIMEAGNRVHAFMRNTIWEPNGVIKQADAASLFYQKGNVEVSYTFLLNSGSRNQCLLSWKTVN